MKFSSENQVRDYVYEPSSRVLHSSHSWIGFCSFEHTWSPELPTMCSVSPWVNRLGHSPLRAEILLPCVCICCAPLCQDWAYFSSLRFPHRDILQGIHFVTVDLSWRFLVMENKLQYINHMVRDNERWHTEFPLSKSHIFIQLQGNLQISMWWAFGLHVASDFNKTVTEHMCFPSLETRAGSSGSSASFFLVMCLSVTSSTSAQGVTAWVCMSVFLGLFP